MAHVWIRKADGTEEAFDLEKLERSLARSGATPEAVRKVAQEVTKELRHGMSTTEIYRRAFGELKRVERSAASRYSLRRAILEFGPTGFPFEDFVAQVFAARGYKTQTDIYVPGKCVEHEVDMIAQKEQECIGAEIKFHNRMGEKTDVKVALYVYARFLDIEAAVKENNSSVYPINTWWLITNTKFTSHAIQYGKCVGIHLLGWTYPPEHNLQTLIEESQIHPLTCLTTLSRQEKQHLLNNGVVLCKALPERTEDLRKAGVPEKKIPKILEESQILCGG